MRNYIFALILILLSYFQVISFFKLTILSTFTPAIYFYKNLSFEVKDFYIFYTNIEGIRKENINLKSKVLELELASSVSRVGDINLEELNRTKNLFTSDNYFENNVVRYSQVLFYNPSFSKLLVTNNDKDSKIKNGNLVLYGRNLIGVVSNISSNIIEVRLLSAKDFDLNTIIVTKSGNKVKTVTSGDKFDGLAINNLLSTEQVGDGDIVITSSTNENIPSDLIIGKLDRIEGISSQTFRKAFIKKFYDLNYINYVGILVND
jgi:cell shape-determining protein MreC